jgi:hypothetical protein|tara:strand:- start:320 stop:580 length:261 start_codon:yes stop_codon:yes gene_type:complete
LDSQVHHLDDGLLVAVVVGQELQVLMVEVVDLEVLMQAVEMAQLKMVLMQGMELLIAVVVVVVVVMATAQERVDLESFLLDIKTKY